MKKFFVLETMENPEKRFELQRAQTRMFLNIKGEIVFPSPKEKRVFPCEKRTIERKIF